MQILLGTLPVAFLVAYGQLILKWRLSSGAVSIGPDSGLFSRCVVYLSDPYIISSYAAALLSSLIWIFVVAKLPLAVAFPVYYGLTFALVILGCFFFLGETLSISKAIAILLIFSGVILGAQSQ